MNFRILAKFLGALLILTSIAMLACGIFAVLDTVSGESAAVSSLFLSAGIVFFERCAAHALWHWEN